jgi:hypothetical protein
MIRSRIQCPPPEPCPGELQRIITKALDPDENFRYQTAVDFRRDLMGFIESAEDAEMQLTSFELADFISGTASDFYSCFISYSTADQELANLLHKDLTAMGVRCWFAPHAVKAGRKLHEQIEEAIRVYDRLLLILSNSSMTSEWVATEIADARRKELREGRHMLFPISVVPFEQIRQWRCFDADAGKDTAREIREYYIPDFSNWRDPNVYSEAFHRLLRDLMAARNR